MAGSRGTVCADAYNVCRAGASDRGTAEAVSASALAPLGRGGRRGTVVPVVVRVVVVVVGADVAEEAVVSAAVVVSASVRAPVKRPEDAEAPPDGSEGPETGVPERPARQNAPIPIARATASTTPPAIHAHSGTSRRRLDAFPPASASSK